MMYPKIPDTSLEKKESAQRSWCRITYRNDLLGVLNVESEHLNAYNEQDQDILGTLAGSLAGIIINARLAERQQIPVRDHQQDPAVGEYGYHPGNHCN